LYCAIADGNFALIPPEAVKPATGKTLLQHLLSVAGNKLTCIHLL